MSRKRGKGAPAKPKPSEPPSLQVCVRLPLDLVARLDAFQERLQSEHPGLTIARADAVRVLLTRGLDEAEGVER